MVTAQLCDRSWAIRSFDVDQNLQGRGPHGTIPPVRNVQNGPRNFLKLCTRTFKAGGQGTRASLNLQEGPSKGQASLDAQ
ncbi:unnamed protein product [Prunus armeniaca]